MAQQDINIGAANAGLGDDYLTAFTKTQANFTENFSSIEALDAMTLKNRIVVNQSNLSTTLGGVIDSTKEYFLDGIVDFTGTGLNIEIPSTGISITGYDFKISMIICTDPAFTLFTSPGGGSGSILFMNMALDIQGVGSSVFDIIADSGLEAFELVRARYLNCESLGTINGYAQGLETGTARIGGKPELTLDGTWVGGYFIDTSLARGLDDGAYTLFKAGPSFVMSSRFRSNQSITLPASASFLDFSSANFANPSTLQLEGCLVNRNGVTDASDANLTPNITPGDIASSWSDNIGLFNTFPGGELNVITEVETIISVVSTFTDLLGDYESDDLQHFDEPANGQLRHLGASPVEYKVSGQMVLEGNSNDVIQLKIVMFRDATTSFEDGRTLTRVINNLQGGRDVAYFVVDDSIILNQNDYVKIQVANATDTSNVTAEIDSYFAVGAR